jgi:tetratricopeptide (TPR) repeat protein
MTKKTVFFLLVVLMLLFRSLPALAETADELYRKGMDLAARNAYAEAIQVFSKTVALDRNFARAYLERGRMYFAMNPSFCTEALADFTTALTLTPEDPAPYYERGLLNAFLLQNEQARADMETAAGLGHQGAREWLEREEKSVVTPATVQR